VSMGIFNKITTDNHIAIMLPSLEIGGFATIASELTTFFEDSGLTISIFTLYGQVKPKGSSTLFSTADAPPDTKVLSKISLFIRRYRLAKRFFKESPSNIVICLDPITYLLAFIVFGNSKSSNLFIACGTPLPLFTRIDRVIARHIFKFARSVVVPSEYFKEELENSFDLKNVIVIPNPIPQHSTFCSLQTSEAEKGSVHFMGRLSGEKGVLLFLKIVEARSDLRFEISGDGIQRNQVLDFIDLGINHNLRYNGWAYSSSVFPRSSTLIISSSHESFGIVVLEAWLHGLMIITSNQARGPAELIRKHGNGVILSSIDDVSLWANAITENVELEPSFLTEILNTYSTWTIGNKWLELIKCLTDFPENPTWLEKQNHI